MHKTCIKTAPIARRFTREQRRIRSAKQPIRSAKRHQTAQPQPLREPPSPTAHRTAPNPSRRTRFPKPITAHAPIAVALRNALLARPAERWHPKDARSLPKPAYGRSSVRLLPSQKIFFAEFIPVGDRQPRPSPTNLQSPKRCQNPCYTAVVGGKPAKEKPSAATDGRKEVSTMEYVVVFRGKRYEFPTWSEMMEFIRDHGIPG